MRDITEVMKTVLKEDSLGLTAADPIEFMTLEQAKEFLKKEAYEKYRSGEESWEYKEYTPANVVKVMKDYMKFAWDKANGCRGISAWRSIMHYRNWLYMLGEDFDSLREWIEDYEYYGKPQLAVLSELLHINWKEYDNGMWVNSEPYYDDEGYKDYMGLVVRLCDELKIFELRKKLDVMVEEGG